MQDMIDVIVTALQFLYFLCSPVLNSVFAFVYKYYESTILALTIGFVGGILVALFVEKKRRETICAFATLTLLFGVMALWMNPDTGYFYDVYVFSDQHYHQIMSEKKEIETLSDRIAELNKEFDDCKENIDKYDKLSNEPGYNEYIVIYNNYVNMYAELSELLDQLESEKSIRVTELNKLINNSPINKTNRADLDLLSLAE